MDKAQTTTMVAREAVAEMKKGAERGGDAATQEGEGEGALGDE